MTLLHCCAGETAEMTTCETTVAAASCGADGASLLQAKSDGKGWPIHLDPPSMEPYNFTKHRKSMKFSQYGQDEILAPILSQIKNGFFVESGAYDGEQMSNTIYYESLGWQGLLVEPGDAYFKIATKKRKAWVFHGAISPSKGSMQLHFTDEKIGQLSHQDETSSRQVQAEPLEKLIQAIDSDRRTVDFWSLDIEGGECKVLESTDFQKLQVGILLVEMNKTPEKSACIRSVLERNGFQDIGKTQNFKSMVIDHVFINQQYVQKRGLSLPKHLHGLH
eukprot:symbB.v1.2.033672.t1/scaffold4216.1/size42974/3